MNCYDCQSVQQTSPAVASCRSCGGGVCSDHANALPLTVHQPHGMGLSTLPLTARRILCDTCARAEQSR
ncbi:DUF2180 family protein [Streptomyces sp. NPDC047002]|uniref:DUF2180 family protein n=1 Tax=Streptomyces sp. NPDC047002 TaxID=3155475 RepID=UPI0034514FBE